MRIAGGGRVAGDKRAGLSHRDRYKPMNSAKVELRSSRMQRLETRLAPRAPFSEL
jgi:hypothetical protein